MGETAWLYDLNELQLRLELAQRPSTILAEAERLLREAGVVYVLMHSDDGGVAVSNREEHSCEPSLLQAYVRLRGIGTEEQDDE